MGRVDQVGRRLRLKWRTEETASLPPRESVAAPSAGATGMPSAAVLRGLRSAANRGDIAEVQRQLAVLGRQYPLWIPVLDRLSSRFLMQAMRERIVAAGAPTEA